uniref:Uncharacterized protein n=1 Tax=Trichuris muris TaxID=70415 RepID=A0A5S6QYB0_TRIMR
MRGRVLKKKRGLNRRQKRRQPLRRKWTSLIHLCTVRRRHACQRCANNRGYSLKRNCLRLCHCSFIRKRHPNPNVEKQVMCYAIVERLAGLRSNEGADALVVPNANR